MLSYILYGIAAVCFLGAIQERKDFMRALSFGAVAAIFALVGFAVSVA